MRHFSLIAACLIAALPLRAGRTITLTTNELADKIRGAWAAQTIGCAYGGPTEFRYRECMIPDEVEIKWDAHQPRDYFDNGPGLYDDVYMDLTFLDVLHKKGLKAPIDDFAQAFAHAPYPLWHANQAARYHILQGGKAPDSGNWRWNPHADDIDYQIEADYAGIICPGMPNTASRISDKVGHLMNYGDGWYGGVFVGAMYTLAYTTDDIPRIVEEALSTIPRKSRFYQTIRDVIDWHALHPTDWKATWHLVQQKWGREVGCPEGVIAPLNIDASLNSAYIVIGLLYGDGDFARTMEISTRCGQDSDCNPASAAGILGCIMGFEKIPSRWREPLLEVEDRPFPYMGLSLRQACEYSMDLARQIIQSEGGSVEGDKVMIRLQKPKAVRLEQGFPNMEPAEARAGGLLGELGPIEFSGTGIVVSNYLETKRQDYVARVEVILDGKPYSTVNSPANYHDRTADLVWIYGLKEGEHRLELRWLNPGDDVKVHLHRIVIYRKPGRQKDKSWAWLGFERPAGINPVLSPDTASRFFCPMQGRTAPWEDSDTFNPAATIINGQVALLYRAEDNSATGIGQRTSRIGYASSQDGLHFQRHGAPVLYPGGDEWEELDCPGGCEDPRVCMTEDGLYVMTYTSWNRKVARLSIATSRDLVHWQKHGPAFAQCQSKEAREGFTKSGSIVTEMKNGRQVIARIDGRYWMYWGEQFVNVATSEDLIHWEPICRQEDGKLLHVMDVRKGRFDSVLTECGPPAIKTNRGIILFYNGKNGSGDNGDSRYTANSYCAGQALFSASDPTKYLDRLDEPFFVPEADFEKSGQYPAGTVFIEGLVPHNGQWYLYYGCADSRVGVAVYNPKK